MIYRIAEIEDWSIAQKKGNFESTDLANEGFIHCSNAEQVARVANLFYKNRKDLVLLQIDETKITAPVKWEDLTNSGESFPHVYGIIPISAIEQIIQFQPDQKGYFTFTQ